MLTMQDPNDGGVYNKCTNANFDGMVMPGVTKAPRYVVQKGTAATLDFAAAMAQAARILKKFRQPLPGLADTCLRAAAGAWQWALRNPSLAFDQAAMNRVSQPVINTGGYGDGNFTDEWFWAAAELMISSPGDQYETVVRKYIDTRMRLPTWADVQMMGNYSLLRCRRSLPGSWEPAIRSLQQRLLQAADGYMEGIKTSAFHTPMGGNRRDFVWGSNGVAASQGMLLVNAWRQNGDKKYLAAALDNLDYVLGRNATGYCFITGMGTHSPMHIHHRPSVADGIVPPVPGLLAGGPNPGRQDHQQYPFIEPETAYIDNDQAYASNEIAINWNAPLVYLSAAITTLENEIER
jgi:endoglucanase